MSKENQEKQLSEEEMKKEMEIRRKGWESFNEDLKNNPDAPLTKKDLSIAIDFISEDVGGLAHMSQVMYQNMGALNQNVHQIIQVISGGGKPNQSVGKTTPSGIILP